MCKCNGESVDHLFLHCLVARDLWSAFWSIWSKLGYATISCQASSLLARPVWSSSKWEYMENHSLLLNVVFLEGEK